MAEGIPRDFDESWPHSDVILITENSGGKVLYANRAVLSVFSPVMAAMFSHNFKEANQESVEIHVDYEAMKEILRIIFQINLPTVLNPQKTYDTAVLMEIYKAADFLDFRSIRQLCVDQIRSISSVDVAVAALELDLHDILMEILGKMSLTCVKTFLVTNNTRLFFSRRDLAILFKKLYCSELTQEKESSSEVLKLEEIAPDVENPRIDLTKKWFASNVAFMTENSAERILYANKGTLASVSERFRELFFDEKMLFKQFEEPKVDNQDCGRDCPLLKLPYEYATMKTILTIIHHCNADYTAESSPYNPALLYDMYRVTSKGRLDMPNIQNMCIANLLKQPTNQSLEVAIRLNLDIKMTEEIPPNFDKPWFDSDIILLTENADGKKLYANKTVLSIFSPVMRAMFTRGFKEANQESVEIHVDYKAMKEILRILFNFNRPTITRRQEAYDCDLLMKMFKSADFLDFGFIRQLCLDQMLSKPTVDIAVAALDLDLHDVLMNILGAMGRGSLQDFLAISNSQLCFSKSDLAVVFKKIYSRKWTENEEKPSEALNLEEVAPEIENPRIDLTKKWFASDVAFMTKNSAERVLYANKGTIAAFSKHFRDLFFDVKMFSKQFAAFVMDEESCDFPILLLDYEYATVKTILTIILQCNDDYTATVPLYNPALLYDMFRVASKDHLDIPNIQKMCIANLLRQPSIESLDVAIRLKLDIKTTLLEKMSGADLLDWLCYSEGMLVYRDGDKDVEISTRRSDILLSLNDLRIVSGKLDSVTMHQLNVSYSDDGWDAPPIRCPYGHRATTSKWDHIFGNDDEEEW